MTGFQFAGYVQVRASFSLYNALMDGASTDAVGVYSRTFGEVMMFKSSLLISQAKRKDPV